MHLLVYMTCSGNNTRNVEYHNIPTPFDRQHARVSLPRHRDTHQQSIRNPGNLQIQALTLYSPVVNIFTTDFNIKEKKTHFANALQLRVQYDDHKSDCCSRNSRSTESENLLWVTNWVCTYLLHQIVFQVPWIRRLVAGLSPNRPGLDPRQVDVGFVVNKLELGQVFLPVHRSSPVSIIPPMFHTHLHVALTRRTSGRKPRNVPQSNPLSVIGKRNFFFF